MDLIFDYFLSYLVILIIPRLEERDNASDLILYYMYNRSNPPTVLLRPQQKSPNSM